LLITYKADCVLDVEADDSVDTDIMHVSVHNRIVNMPVFKKGRKSSPPV